MKPTIPKSHDDWLKLEYHDWLDFIDDHDFATLKHEDRLQALQHLNRYMCGHCGIEWINRKESSRLVTERRLILSRHFRRLYKIHDKLRTY